MQNHKKTLLLNQNYQPIKSLGWKKTFCLTFLNKVEILEQYKVIFRTCSKAYKLPAVIRLIEHVNIKYNTLKLSRYNIFTRDNNQCQYCAKKLNFKEMTIDHVIPKSLGGKNTWNNVVTCCAKCNVLKNNRTPQQANMKLIKRPKMPKNSNLFYCDEENNMPDEWKKWIFS